MALSFVGGDAASGGALAVTLTLPVGIAQNDIVIAVHCSDGGGADIDMALSTSGYTELADLYANDTADTNLFVGRKVMGASPDATVVTNDYGSNVAAFHCWRGGDTTTPEDAAPTTATGTDGGTADPPSITTVTAGAVVLAIGGSSEPDAITNAPSGYTNLFDAQAAIPNVAISSKEIASPAAENPASYADIVGQVGDSWAAVSVAIRPLVTAGGLLPKLQSHAHFAGGPYL